jgi:hypothetical protein
MYPKLLASVVLGAASYVAGIPVEALLSMILTLELATFAVIIDHRGRISTLETLQDQKNER